MTEKQLDKLVRRNALIIGNPMLAIINMIIAALNDLPIGKQRKKELDELFKILIEKSKAQGETK